MTIGIDVYQGNGTIDWAKAKAAGNLGLVGIRCAYGAARDTKFVEYTKQCNDLGIPWFAYLFLRFGQVASPEDQAKCALDTVAFVGDSPYRLTHAIDLEFPGGKRPAGVTPGAALAWFLRCYVTMKAGLGGADPGVYTSRVVWIDPDGMNDLPCTELEDAWSWPKYWPYAVGSSAVYNPATVNSLPAPLLPPPCNGNWNLHQHQGDAVNYPGIATKVDMNRTQLVQKGAAGGRVTWIQRKLIRAGFAITADGAFGSLTKTAVEQFQASRKLFVDGIVGLATMSCLSRVA